MTKAIHLKNERVGIRRRGLTRWPETEHGWRSCCWLLNEAEQAALLGGWVYLHDSKSTRSRFAGQILGFEPAERHGTARTEGVAILFRADARARDQSWRGADYAMAWSGGGVDADLPHEQG